MDSNSNSIRPHPGPQEAFLTTAADIAIYGGQAGGGKTFALLMEPLRHIAVPGFGAVTFRRTTPQIRREGGLWDESAKMYISQGARPRETYLEWIFPSGNRLAFASMEYDHDRYDWDGSQIPLICFDQLEHFTETQFFYMLSRNRSTCGIKPYIRATANPDPDSFLAEFLEWWIDDDGYPILERAGILRYFIRQGDDIIWADSEGELTNQYIGSLPLSVTFIPASIEDNPTLLDKDPSYLAKLDALPHVERERLRRGNWRIRPSAGAYFKREDFHILDSPPPNDPIIKAIRQWDLAATTVKHRHKRRKTNPDWTVGLKMARRKSGIITIEHMIRFRGTPYQVELKITSTADTDTRSTIIGLNEDPGQAGKSQVSSLTRQLHGFNIKASKETGDKETRASPLSSQVQAGNVYLIAGKWNQAFLSEMENFPEGAKDDVVDAASAGYNKLLGRKRAGSWGRAQDDQDQQPRNHATIMKVS